MAPIQLEIVAANTGNSESKIKTKIAMVHSALAAKRIDEALAKEKIAAYESCLVKPKTAYIVTDEAVARKFIKMAGSASKRGIENKLTLAHVRRLLKRKTCFYTGVTMTEPANDGSVNNSDRTFDRIDASKGYTDSNVVACTHFANHLKNLLLENKSSSLFCDKETLKKFVKNVC